VSGGASPRARLSLERRLARLRNLRILDWGWAPRDKNSAVSKLDASARQCAPNRGKLFRIEGGVVAILKLPNGVRSHLTFYAKAMKATSASRIDAR